MLLLRLSITFNIYNFHDLFLSVTQQNLKLDTLLRCNKL